MIVMKFGGTSVGNAERMTNVAKIVKSHIKKKPVIVVSAITKMTDALIMLAKESSQGKGSETLHLIKKAHYEILEQLGIGQSLLEKEIEELSAIASKIRDEKNINNKILDYFQSFGERMSAKIVAEELNKAGIKAMAFNSWELGFLTDSEFGNAEPLEIAYNNLKRMIKQLNIVPVITGFIGKTEKGEITTLGRGGSDYSAAIIGAAIDADEIQIWTDVSGIMSTDPKIVNNAKTIDKISFAEASELAYFGARVLHPKTILPAMKKGVPVKVLNSFNPKGKGTAILNEAGKEKQIVKAIAYKKGITLINVESTRMLGAFGFLASLFGIFNDYRKSVDVVSTSEVSVSLTIDNDEGIDGIMHALKGVADITVEKNKAIICIVGERMRHTHGIAGRTFTALGRNRINIEMISQGASKINITFVVDEKDAEKAVQILHREYFE